MIKVTNIELELISDVDMYLLSKKEWEDVFLTLVKDTVKQIINTWHMMIVMKKVNLLFI